MDFLPLLLIGLVAGFLSGLLGIGGGLVFTPILFYLFTSNGIETPVSFTIATSLFCIILVSASSTYKHIKQKNFNLNESIFVALFGVLGTTIGKQITTSGYYSEPVFSAVFMMILLYTAYSFLVKQDGNSASGKSQELPIKAKDGFMVGGLGGFVAALAGVGGGIIMVPFLNLRYHKPFHQTVSITSFAIMIISLAAVFQFALSDVAVSTLSPYSLGYVDFGAAFPLALGGMITANYGAKLSTKLNRVLLKRLFAIMAILEAIRLASEFIVN
ncbi:sulfite exporter TauE/SafE family protein [bacterium]|nr:MAG: sulfite exporter TauE/SafE family protein [bacterium]